MTAKSEPAPISEELRVEIERECFPYEGHPVADHARIAAYVDAKVREALEDARQQCMKVKDGVGAVAVIAGLLKKLKP